MRMEMTDNFDDEAAARRLARKLLARGAADTASGGSLLEWLAGAGAAMLAPCAVAGVSSIAPGAAAPLGGAGGAIGGALAVLAGAAGKALGGFSPATGKIAAKCAGESTAGRRRFAILKFRSTESARGAAAAGRRWRATLLVPVSDEGRIGVLLTVPRRATGVFFFCGTETAISDGRGTIPLSAIRAGLSRGGVAFALPGASPVPGAPFLEDPSQ